MGIKFGNLGYVRGIITYSLSPFEQRAFAGAIKQGIPNMMRRFFGQAFIVLPPFVAGYLVFDWGEKEYQRLARKNPKDYENDE